MISEAAQIPPATLEALDAWRDQGLLPGGFVRSCLENDFSGAVCRADQFNVSALYPIALYLIWEMPSACWGSEEKVRAWAAKFGTDMHDDMANEDLDVES